MNSFSLPTLFKAVWTVFILIWIILSITTNIMVTLLLCVQVVLMKILEFILIITLAKILASTIEKIELLFTKNTTIPASFKEKQKKIPEINQTPLYIVTNTAIENKPGIAFAIGGIITTPTPSQVFFAEFYLRYPEDGPNRTYNLLQIKTCGKTCDGRDFVKPWEGTPVIQNALNFERRRLFQHPEYTVNQISQQKSWNFADKAAQDAYLKNLHFNDMYRQQRYHQPIFNERKVIGGDTRYTGPGPQDNVSNPHNFILEQFRQSQKKFTENLIIKVDVMRSRITGLEGTVSQAQNRNSTLKAENIGVKAQAEGVISHLQTQIQELTSTVTTLRANLSAEIALKVSTNTQYLQIMKSTAEENDRRFAIVKADNPYSGLRSANASAGMWKERRLIELPQIDIVTAAQRHADEVSRETFLRYVFRDAFKLYFNTVTKVKLDTKLPLDVRELAEPAARHSITALAEFLAEQGFH